ncbi:membrane protein [Tamlana nanhaiensis]|uniref:Membrane protein n=1 Tax=Neotamlana nanhaiensis TaxID=1382798 RepID=A0A0D7VW08_9FLAO|nr:hypothetical protein [Tamlana nanhaiensis]KJD31065.1 membrane protein [Tamlana nanhaiensis]
MKYSYKVILMVILAAITIYGLATGKYLFLVFMFPLGLNIFKKKNDH